jgi:diadenylate cyclase
MERTLIFLIDVALCTLLLRLVIGWLLIYPRLVKMLGVLIIIGLLGFGVFQLDLPFAGILALALILPLTVMLILSFLPELGRIYQSASRGAFFRPKLMNSQEIIPELTECLNQMKRKRIGALLVFPGVQSVDDFISGGEELDAKVNRSLILSIFNPHCPRHDGAIVIRNNRIVHIGGVLPLASADGAAAHYGTRHLAALGLTERCDADVLIVSEERGVISHSYEGKLDVLPNNEPKKLQKVLSGIIGHSQSGPTSRQSRTLALGLWVVALGLSVVGSLQVTSVKERILEEQRGAPVVVKSVEAPIQFTNRPEGTFIVGTENVVPRILVNVPESIQMPANPTILIDLKNAPVGPADLNLQASMVKGLPPGVSVERFEPANIRFRVEKEQQLKIRIVRPEVFGLRDSLHLEQLDYEPKEVEAVVRDAEWKKSNTLKVLPVDLSQIETPGEHALTVKLNIPASINLSGTDEIQITLKVVEDKR